MTVLHVPPLIWQKFYDKNIAKFNPHLRIEQKENAFVLSEISPAESEYFTLNLPAKISNDDYTKITSVNEDLRLEFLSDKLFIYNSMGGIIGAITILIASGLLTWALSRKRGRVYSEETEYYLPNPDNTEEFWRRKADVSYIAYESVSEETQRTFKGAIPVPPDLAIEIVSSKYGLNPALLKAQYFWRLSGVKIALVICPFSKKIYIFDAKGKREQNIEIPFRHELLPDYVGYFGTYSDEL